MFDPDFLGGPKLWGGIASIEGESERQQLHVVSQNITNVLLQNIDNAVLQNITNVVLQNIMLRGKIILLIKLNH